MPMHYFKLLATILLTAVSAIASATSPVTWPVSPSRLSLSTPYGTLDVAPSEYVYESRLRINNSEVNPAITGMLNITYAFSTPKAHIALVSINSGSNTCPVSYRWVILQESGYSVSPEFGSCSDLIKVSAQGRLLTLQTPSHSAPGQIDVYTYDGKSIKHKTAKH